MSDWIEWGGGECPVDGDVEVDVRYRDGYEEVDGWWAISFAWKHVHHELDIIAYRIHKES